MNDRSGKRYDSSDHEIDALALDHSFDELTRAERDRVLARLGSEEAYRQLRSVLLMTRRELHQESRTLEPRPEIRADIHAAMRERRAASARRRLTLGDLLSYRVPAYTSIAGFAAALVLAVMLGQSRLDDWPIVQERIVYVPAGDTHLVEIDKEEIVRRVTDSLKAELARKPVEQPALRASSEPTAHPARPQKRSRNRASQPDTESAQQTPSPVSPSTGNQFVGLANLPQLDVQKRGKNLAEDSNSRQFRWSAARDSF